MRRITRRLRRGFKRASEALVGTIAIGVLKGMRLVDPDRIADFAGGMCRRIGPLLPENRIGRANLLNAFPEKSKREIDAILVTELSRWGRSTQDLVQTLDDLHSWKVSVLAQTGLSFDLSTASGKLMRTIMAGLAEFERDLIRDRVKSGLAAAKARGVVLGRQEGQRPSDKKAKKVLKLHEDGLSYRLIGRNVGLSKNTVMDIVRRRPG